MGPALSPGPPRVQCRSLVVLATTLSDFPAPMPSKSAFHLATSCVATITVKNSTSPSNAELLVVVNCGKGTKRPLGSPGSSWLMVRLLLRKLLEWWFWGDNDRFATVLLVNSKSIDLDPGHRHARQLQDMKGVRYCKARYSARRQFISQSGVAVDGQRKMFH
ncbi:hypothetical protein GGR56DRAFT_187115 [Xylariaceae sp. FL0804]|nr:hypothetical protein GGR56DRAFT_187115 [Xylariaceae sp. FL0804]